MVDFFFKIFNTTWTVSYVDKIEKDDSDAFVFGHTDSIHNRIRVATKDSEGNILPDSTINITTLHEMVHAMLIEGQYSSCSDDEPLVEWLANCLYSLKEQHKL